MVKRLNIDNDSQKSSLPTPFKFLRGDIFFRSRATRGTVAITLMLIIAVALVFYAITLNWGKIVQTKTIVTVASNTAASVMASLMASYGEQVVQTSLGGEREICGWTMVFVIFLLIIIIILLIVITGPAGWALAIAIIGLVLAIGALIIQLAVIEPGLTSMWNKQSQDTLSIAGRFVETGIRTALQQSVADREVILDTNDRDLDRVFQGSIPEPGSIPGPDYINRFGFYYQKRLDSAGDVATNATNGFINGLTTLLYGDPLIPKWNHGLMTQIDCSDPEEHICCPDPLWPPDGKKPIPPQCNPCCVPLGLEDTQGICDDPKNLSMCVDGSGGKKLIRLRPVGCRTGELLECNTGPFGAAYPYVYEPYFAELIRIDGKRTGPQNIPIPLEPDPWSLLSGPVDCSTQPEKCMLGLKAQNELSFRQKIGRDDESKRFKVKPPPVDPNNPFDPTDPQDPDATIPPVFRMQDTYGYYAPPSRPIIDSSNNLIEKASDPRVGIFPLLWKTAEWKRGVSGTGESSWRIDDIDNPGSASGNSSCIWCKQVPCPLDLNPELKNNVGQLQLLNPCSAERCCVGFHDTPGPGGSLRTDPRVTDNVAGIQDLIWDPNVDANDKLRCLVGPYSNFDKDAQGNPIRVWKKGGDFFCADPEPPGSATTWPYAVQCAKQGICTEETTFDKGTKTQETTKNVRDCECGEKNHDCLEDKTTEEKVTVNTAPLLPENWPDDPLDEVIYGLPDFLKWAEGLLGQPRTVLFKEVETWYRDAAEWIEPKCDKGIIQCSTDPALFPLNTDKKLFDKDCPETVLDRPEDGRLIKLRDDLVFVRNPIAKWLNGDMDGDDFNSDGLKDSDNTTKATPSVYIGASCLDPTPNGAPPVSVWCVPPQDFNQPLVHCSGVSKKEFDFLWSDRQHGAAGGVYGNLEAVVNCLWWNALDRTANLGWNTLSNKYPKEFAVGNSEKFDLCSKDCRNEHCDNLPRSLKVPDIVYIPSSDPVLRSKLQTCANSDGSTPLNQYAQCNANCNFQGQPYNGLGIPNFQAPEMNWLQILLGDESNPNSLRHLCAAAAPPPPAGTFPIDCGTHGTLTSCAEPFLLESCFDIAMCDALNSCCPWDSTNPFYQGLVDLLNSSSGICGANWGPGQFFWDAVAKARGSCNGDSPIYNTYWQSVNRALQTAVNVRDSQMQTDTTRCLNCLNKGCFTDKCVVECQGLESRTYTIGGVTNNYGVERYFPFVPPPNGGVAVPVWDILHIHQFNLCLGAGDCTTDCFNLPAASPTNGSYNLPPTPTLAILVPGACKPPNGCDDVEIGLVQACLDDCSGNASSCQRLLSGLPDGGISASGKDLSTVLPAFTAPDTALINSLNNCKSNCTIGCQTALRFMCGDSTIRCNDPGMFRSKVQNCACNFENSCSGFPWACGEDPDDNPVFYDAVLAAMQLTGSCSQPFFDSTFKPWLEQSRDLAINQVAKFKIRYKFLKGRFVEAQFAREALDAAINQMTNFLGVRLDHTLDDARPARQLTRAVITDPAAAVGDLPYTAIYVWQTKPPKKPPRPLNPNKGYWHAVRVDARIPRRCDNICGSDGGGDPEWPRVKTKSSLFTRCYILDGDRGLVKAQVIRWDEERESTGVFFPNGIQIWRFKFFHPSGQPATSTEVATMEAKCGSLIDPRALGAFIINKPDDSPADNQACWKSVNKLLQSGVMTQTCAQYYYHGGARKGFNLKFVKCPPLP